MGALLDTHTLYWFVAEAAPLADEALVAIADAQAANQLFVSPITAWELGVIAQKSRRQDRPDLGALRRGSGFGKRSGRPMRASRRSTKPLRLPPPKR